MLDKSVNRSYVLVMLNRFEEITAHTTPETLIAIGTGLLEEASHQTFTKQKYLDRAAECFAMAAIRTTRI